MSKKIQPTTVSAKEVKARTDAFESLCRKRGIRLTPQRLTIYREVAATNEHPDVETVFKRVRKKLRTISHDTVYRTLNLLQDNGILSKVEVLCDRIRFDANRAPHHHFICTSCGLVRDFYSSVVDDFRPPKAVKKIGQVDSCHLELRGTCADCRGIKS